MALFGLLVLLGGWIAIDIGIVVGELPPVGSWRGVSWSVTSNGRPSADAAWISIIISAVAIWLTLFNLVREIVYLELGRYWIEITTDGMTLVTPLGSRHYRWHEIPHFSARTFYLTRPKIVRVMAWISWFRWVSIRSGDFASDIDPSREEAARIFADALNQVGDQLRGKSVSTVTVPADLRIAPIGAGVIRAAPDTRTASRTVVRKG